MFNILLRYNWGSYEFVIVDVDDFDNYKLYIFFIIFK